MATPQEIQRLLDEIQRTYDRLGATNPFANYDTSNITDAVTEAQRLQTALRGVQQALRDTSTGAEEIRDAFSRAVDEIKNQSSAIGQSTKALRGLQSIAQKLSYDQAGITKLSKKELPKIIIGNLARFNNLQKGFLPSRTEISEFIEVPKCNEGKVKFK
jgi:methyl-accepting chemotaxis protein